MTWVIERLFRPKVVSAIADEDMPTLQERLAEIRALLAEIAE